MDSSGLAIEGIDPARFRLRLRQATAEIHTALDDRFAELGWDSPLAYRTFVRMNEACHRVLEPWLETALPPEENGQRPRFAGPLAQDMDAMRLKPLPPPVLPFATADLANAAGVAYVLDGSRLGARMIVRQLSKTPPPFAPLSLHYLRAASAPGPVFSTLDRVALRLEERDIPRSTEAACQTFALFGTMSEYAARR